MNKKFGILALGLLIFGALASNVRADHSWGSYHWPRDANPVGLQVIDSVVGDWDPIFSASLQQWDDYYTAKAAHPGDFYFNISADFSEPDADNDFLNFSDGGSDEGSRARKRCTAVDGKIRVCNAAYGQNGWLGMASIAVQNDHIIAGTAKMNDSYDWYFDAVPGERPHVMCQEIGHLFGLGHTSEDGTSQKTCMDYSSDLESATPNAHDFEQLLEIYTHLDDLTGGPSGSGPSPCPPRKKNCSRLGGPEVPPMGYRVHKGKYHEIWVARGANGTLWVHHVTLVPEEYR